MLYKFEMFFYAHIHIHMSMMNIHKYVEREGPNGEKSLQHKLQDFGSEIQQYVVLSVLSGEIIH